MNSDLWGGGGQKKNLRAKFRHIYEDRCIAVPPHNSEVAVKGLLYR